MFPPKSDQKPGDIPLGECINNTTSPTPFGPGCWQILFNPPEPAHNEVESTPDSNDTRMQQTWYVNGTIWGAADTAVWVDGQLKAGIAWFAVAPKINGAGKIEGKITKQGYLALARNNLTYPAIAMTPSGQGVIAFTVMGQDFYPSAGYARIDAAGKVGAIHIAAAGLGPDDGFTSYKAFVGDPPRTRWGDYGGRGHGREQPLDRVGVHRADLHLRAVLPEPAVPRELRLLQRDPHVAGQLVHPTDQARRQRRGVDVRRSQGAGLTPAPCAVARRSFASGGCSRPPPARRGRIGSAASLAWWRL